MFNWQKKLFFVLILLGQITIFSSLVKAKYVPPPEQERASDYSKGTGVRNGFSTTNMIPLTILAPVNYVGHSISNQPTFVWVYGSSDQDYTLQFRLFEFDQQGQLQQRGDITIINNKGGLISLPFPKKQAPLEEGKKYLWQVSLAKNAEQVIWQRAEFKVQKNKDYLATNSLVNLNPTERIEFYAQNGLWYDALAESLKLSSPSRVNSMTQELICALSESEKNYLSDHYYEDKNQANINEIERIKNLEFICNSSNQSEF